MTWLITSSWVISTVTLHTTGQLSGLSRDLCTYNSNPLDGNYMELPIYCDYRHIMEGTIDCASNGLSKGRHRIYCAWLCLTPTMALMSKGETGSRRVTHDASRGQSKLATWTQSLSTVDLSSWDTETSRCLANPPRTHRRHMGLALKATR